MCFINRSRFHVLTKQEWHGSGECRCRLAPSWQRLCRVPCNRRASLCAHAHPPTQRAWAPHALTSPNRPGRAPRVRFFFVKPYRRTRSDVDFACFLCRAWALICKTPCGLPVDSAQPSLRPRLLPSITFTARTNTMQRARNVCGER